MRTGLIVVAALVAVGCVPPKESESAKKAAPTSRWKGTARAEDWRYRPVSMLSVPVYEADHSPEKLVPVDQWLLRVAYWDIVRIERWAAEAEKFPPTAQETKNIGDRKARLRAEIDERGLISEARWGYVDGRTIQIGMSEAALLAAWGPARDVNRTVTADGTHKQHVYSNGYLVYTDNGSVTSWQD